MSTPRKPRCLLIGDFICTTGFGRVNEQLARRLQREWDLRIMGINTFTDPNPLQRQFNVYPAQNGDDNYGLNRIPYLVHSLKPDVLLIHLDSWNVPAYTQTIEDAGLKLPPVVAYCPPDGKNQAGVGVKLKIKHLLCPTQFGIDEIRESGYQGPASILPYGVETRTYFPMNKTEARAKRGMPTDKFVFGRADRNVHRKRHDLTIQAFALIHKQCPEAVLQLHCSLREPTGWNLPQLANYYGVGAKVYFSDPNLTPDNMLSEWELNLIYNAWDVHVSTVRGEGWGLVTHESAAARVAQVLPNFAAYGEWMKGACRFIPVTHHPATIGGHNTIGGLPTAEDTAKILREMYENPKYVAQMADLAYARATEPRFSWDVIAERMNEVLHEAAGSKAKAAESVAEQIKEIV